LVAITAVAAYQYYKQIRLAHKEYIKARDFVEDIVLSFDRELKRESEKFDSMTSKVEGSLSTAEVSYRKAETIEKQVEPLKDQLNSLNQSYQAISQIVTEKLSENTENNITVLSGLSGLEAKLRDIEASQKELNAKIAGFEEQIEKLSAVAPQVQAQAVPMDIALPPIPIKRDKAMAALTETEIVVLEMLSKEGSKTAPEIKERVQLSREHTARLMKKLYEEGYLEREAGKIPFRYSIKKEMEALLHRVENPATT
jgi:prefoldin subunit 5